MQFEYPYFKVHVHTYFSTNILRLKYSMKLDSPRIEAVYGL